ncbi:MAG: fused MFS/spermidine synthase [Opitutae bacterium]|nr:fused MFS/spermidine synthase [Opitutae bacterium]
MPAYALTIFTGAFLLFQVQPLIGKYILPWFGGSPGVWTTCMLFFQMLLLGGYAYAHFTTQHLKPKKQAYLHLLLLGLSLALLPITPAESWKPTIAGDPTWRILALLTVSLGLPYFVLSSTGPLLQQWFGQTHPGASPYRLYALSNAGSLLALLSYPFYFESAFTRQAQANLWAMGLGAFVLGCGYCAWRFRKLSGADTPAAARVEETPAPAPTWSDRIYWIALPAVASLLLLATTNKLCQDVAVIPFLWVLPLSLYLLTFIICFDNPRWYGRPAFGLLLTLGVASVCHLLFAGFKATLAQQIVGYSATLFVGCMFCHGELYRLKPHPRHLTSFYLLISAGGALGGLLAALVAPAVFNSFLELHVSLWALGILAAALCLKNRSLPLLWALLAGVWGATLLVPVLRLTASSWYTGTAMAFWQELKGFYSEQWWGISLLALLTLGCFGDLRRVFVRAWRPRTGSFAVTLALLLGAILLVQVKDSDRLAIVGCRNFYGVLAVFEYDKANPDEHYFVLQHGKITHGLQFADPVKSAWPTSYYGRNSGIGLALDNLPERPEGRRLGLVGLGTGSLATYGLAGDRLRIYEINPQVEQLARSHFTYLERCAARIDVVMGDARLSMETELRRRELQQFDLLALDAFSSDAIPVHLLTREAFAVYLEHLRPGGVIAVHISNRYLDLLPVVHNLAQHFDLGMAAIADDHEDDWWLYATTWVLLTKNRAWLASDVLKQATEAPRENMPAIPLWTDDYASLYPILK